MMAETSGEVIETKKRRRNTREFLDIISKEDIWEQLSGCGTITHTREWVMRILESNLDLETRYKTENRAMADMIYEQTLIINNDVGLQQLDKHINDLNIQHKSLQNVAMGHINRVYMFASHNPIDEERNTILIELALYILIAEEIRAIKREIAKCELEYNNRIAMIKEVQMLDSKIKIKQEICEELEEDMVSNTNLVINTITAKIGDLFKQLGFEEYKEGVEVQ